MIKKLKTLVVATDRKAAVHGAELACLHELCGVVLQMAIKANLGTEEEIRVAESEALLECPYDERGFGRMFDSFQECDVCAIRFKCKAAQEAGE